MRLFNTKATQAMLFAVPLLLFAGAQAVHPVPRELPHKPLLSGAALPLEVQSIFSRACQDCHSNNTEWPWYSRMLPVSEFIAADVRNGRAFLNLSDWQSYSRSQKLGYLAAMSFAAVDRKMPPEMYAMMHPDARLSDREREEIAGWAKEESSRLRSGKPASGQ